ncbi:right-handed parallel beta-helix repeat-containing protein, partial [Archaeoglobus sp.]
WNFNGDWRYSSCYYNSTYDVVYGHYNGTSLNQIEFGGYSAYIPSSAHDVGYYTDITGWGNTLLRKGIWGNISRNALSNNTFYDGDAATALAWDKPTLNQFEVWVIPIIWGFGYTFEDMVNEIQKGKSMLYDTGIKSIDFPENNSNFNPNTANEIYVNATVALYGLVDVWNLNVTINVTQLDGTYTYENYTFVNLSVPFNETAQVSFPIDISSMPYGTYKITIKTNLPNDQNTTNDEKWIIIHIASFTVEPDQTKVGKAGEEILYNVTAYNYYSAGRFDVNIIQSTKGWITRLYDNGTIVAEDSDGDGLWDYVNSSYDTNGNGLPDVYIPYGVSNVTVSKVIPPNAPLGEVDYTTLDFVSVSNTAIHDDVTLTTKTPPPPTAQKTFYLHDISLNTTSPNLESPTPVSPNSLFSWQQIPKFADNFNVVGSIVIPLWLNSTYLSTHTVTVSLFYTDGVTSYTLGSQTKTVTLSTIPQLEIFNITLTSQTVIPMGYYLILRVENTQTTATIYIFHSQYYPSNITLNTTTYVKVQSVTTNKTEYKVKETALILANVTDPIGSYDITNANITVYYPNGTLYISDVMNLNAIDSSVPSLWKLYDYTLYLPVSGIYNGTICGIESNGVAFCQRFNISVTPIKIVGRIFEDLGALGLPYNPSEDRLVPNVTVALFKDNETAGIQGVLDGNDTLVAITTTNSSGYYNFTINDTATYFVAVNSRTVNTTRGLNSGYTINNIWAEQTFVVTWNGTAYENQTKFGGVNAEISDNWSAGIYDDYAIVNASTYNGESIDFGFSFDVIVNTRDEGQGSIGQFILNANAIKGDDRAEFRIPTTDPNYQNGVFTISLSEGDLPTIEDANTTIDGSTQPVGVIEINANYCTAINTTAYNTTIANITISNFYYGVKATQNGCDGLRMENVTFEGNATGVAIYLEDTNWDFQQFKTIVDKVTINVKGNYIYGIQLVNRIWLDLSNSFINVSGGVGIYWINYANDYAKLNVTNVTVENCNHGIYLNGSNNATFENVTVVDSTYEGVFISNSRDVEFTNSTFENNSVGLYSSSSSIELINGTLTNNRFEGIQLRNSNLESKSSLIERNSVGINAISSTLNVSDSLVIDNIYEGIVINDTESNLSNVTATNNTYGIYVESKNVSIIDSKTFENRLSGIYVVNSTNVVVDSVQSSNNNEDGLNIYNSSYITVANSTFIGNNDSGISTYDNVTNLTIYNCSFINNGNFNIGNTYSYSGVAMSVPYEKVAENVTIANCIFENNGYANVSNKGMGILIYSEGQAQNFTIEDNFINASWRDGIFVRGINNLRIENNTVTYNGQVGGDPAGSGIKVVGNDSLNVYIANNNCSYNEDNGISVEGSGNRYLKNVTIYNNTLLHNGIDANDGNALFIGGRVVNVLVKGNIMKFSDAQAILIQEPYGWLQQDWIGSNITIEGNLMEWNGLTIQSGNTTAVITVGAYGSYYQDDGYIVIEGNTFLNNSLCPNSLYGGKMGGIEIYGLNNTSVDLTFVVKNNTIVNCTAYGIDVSYSRNVLIENNTVRECEVGVAVVEQSYNVTIVNNSIYNNTFLGIDLNLDNVTLNDGILNVNQPNYGIDYPVITYAEFNGTYLYVEGYIGSNFSNATVDIYLVKNSTGGDNLIGNNVSSNGSLNDSYGEGWMYLGRLMANSSGDFEGWINVEGKGIENYALITSTATLNGIGTSEFGPDYLIVKKVNVTVGITAFWQNDHLNVTITVKPYRDLRNINVYWIKPENVTVINVSGDYDANVTLGNYYSWEFYSLSAGEIKRIYINATISGEVSLVNVYNIGVDPKVIG